MRVPLLALGKYQVVERVGAGGMATVYLARVVGAMGFEKLVSLKVLNEDASRDQERVRMFIDEARLGARLSHPNIVSVLDFGEADGRYFMAMEYVDGMSLKDLLKSIASGRRIRQASRDAVIYLLRSLARALTYVHDLRDHRGRPLHVIHRDLSPHNVLVDRGGMVKLCDFGIAKGDFRQDATREGLLKGKPAYMAPEQASGKGGDVRTDLYALGLVIYEVLTLRPAIDGENTAELLAKARRGVPPEVVEQATEDTALRAILKRLLASDRTERYGSANELLEALREAGGDDAEGEKEMAQLVGQALRKKGSKKYSRKGTKNEQTRPSAEEIRASARFLRLVLLLVAAVVLVAVAMTLTGISLTDLTKVWRR